MIHIFKGNFSIRIKDSGEIMRAGGEQSGVTLCVEQM
jgi:hypothetical protein